MATILDLPIELMVKIFSQITLEDKMKAFKVCKKFNRVSLTPSFWKKLEINTRTRTQMSSFCKYFSRRPFLKKLSLYNTSASSNECLLSDSEIDEINNLLKRLRNLRYLTMDNIDFSSINFPPILKRLGLINVHTFPGKCSWFFQTKFPDSLRHLSIRGTIDPINKRPEVIINKEIEILLEKYKACLISLSLHVESSKFKSRSSELPGWIPTLGAFNNLKKLKLSIRVTESGLIVLLASISTMTSLETLHITYRYYFGVNRVWAREVNVSDIDGFPNVKDLKISCDKFKLWGFPRKAFPKLEMFSLSEQSANLFAFYYFIKRRLSLKYIGYSSHGYAPFFLKYYLVDELADLKRRKNLTCVCVCSFISSRSISILNRGRIRREMKQNLSFLNCKKTQCSRFKFSFPGRSYEGPTAKFWWR